jgi:hypothetical protein
MPAYQKVSINGELRLIPVEEPQGHKNPDVKLLNAAQREMDAERRDDVAVAVSQASASVREALLRGRSVKKPLRPPLKAASDGEKA